MNEGKLLKKVVLQEIEFDCDILITDPGYVTTSENRSLPNYIKHITNDTLYGDWSCHVWKASDYSECIEENVLGQFCADGGLVTVADWKEVKMHNPEAEKWVKEHDWCATVIKGFKGTVQMVRFDKEYEYGHDWEVDKPYGHRKGDKYKAASLELFGKGNINWIAAQTGL